MRCLKAVFLVLLVLLHARYARATDSLLHYVPFMHLGITKPALFLYRQPGPTFLVPPDYRTYSFGFFCRMEQQFNRVKLPVILRLGTHGESDLLEGKTR